MTTIRVEEHGSPLVLSLPHAGTELPDGVRRRMTEIGRMLPDTDWHIDRLYAFADNLPATTVQAVFSRYVIDVNRDPSGASLYPGQATTGLCPTTTFDGEPLYLPGQEPEAQEIEERRTTCFDAYHTALAEQIERPVFLVQCKQGAPDRFKVQACFFFGKRRLARDSMRIHLCRSCRYLHVV